MRFRESLFLPLFWVNRRRMRQVPPAVRKKPAPVTGVRKRHMITEGSPKEQAAELAALLRKDGYDFTVGIPMDTPIIQAERVVSAGQGIGEKEI